MMRVLGGNEPADAFTDDTEKQTGKGVGADVLLVGNSSGPLLSRSRSSDEIMPVDNSMVMDAINRCSPN
jgi:hypothetical protein